MFKADKNLVVEMISKSRTLFISRVLELFVFHILSFLLEVSDFSFY